MSGAGDGQHTKSTALTTTPDPSTYDVGYAKPPAATRFKKGKSGNPRGRPKGAKNKLPALNEERLKTIILEEAYRTISVRDGDRNVSVPMAQAVVRSLSVNAAKGNARAQRLFAEMLTSTERANKALADEWLNTAMNYKIEWDKELDRRRSHGITHLPDPLPHPDHVVIDMRNGTANLRGPATKEEKADVDHWVSQLPRLRSTVEDLRADLDHEDDAEERADIQKHIDLGEALHKDISEKVGPLVIGGLGE